jgi:MoCo/4Fe-4S cofactor protein with predicted Tat translocation signal
MNPRKDLGRRLEERLRAAQGQKYWRTLEELADTEAFQEMVRLEFPDQADIWPDSLSRRRFLTLMGASLALAGVSGCSVKPAPSRDIIPYVRQPEEVTPGRPLFYATAMTLGGTGVGLLVESHLGRPTKIEGNPDHPASLGATDLYHQASILDLYDPDRSQTVTHLGQTRTWDDAFSALRGAMREQAARRGAGLRLLTERVVSPTMARQLQQLRDHFGEARWHQYEPLAPDNAFRASTLAFNRYVNVRYDLTRAERVLSFDNDFLACGPGNLRYVADFMSRRRVRNNADSARQAEMNRLYMVETMVSNTGAKADHRLVVRPGEMESVARGLAARLGAMPGPPTGPHQRWIEAVARDLEQHRGRCVVLAGDRQPPTVHLLAHALNQHLDNVRHTVFYTEPVPFQPVDTTASLRELVEDMDAGHVEGLLILGGNPMFTAPADLHFAESLQRMRRLNPRALLVHMSLYQDETSRQCHWHLPEAHWLEAWSDTRAFDGTASIVQPLIQPLYQGRSYQELLSFIANDLQTPGYEIVRATWREDWESHGRSGNFETFWQTSVHDGVIADTRLPDQSATLNANWQQHLGPTPTPAALPEGQYDIVFQHDPTIYDGRFANNSWLQELPKPITKITWDNAALMSPETARALRVSLGSYAHGGEHGGYHPDVVELQLEGRTVSAPIWIVPGHADGAITVTLGYGRQYAGRVGSPHDSPRVGFNAYVLRTSAHPWSASGLTVRKTGANYLVACTQQHQLMENREPVRSATLDRFKEEPRFAVARDEEQERGTSLNSRRPLTMYQPYPYPGHKWGMVIDLTTCVGCKACVVACQAENNIPVVGKDQVSRGREMHWLRIDRYISGPFENPREFHFQPVPCMHCEHAPCEYVCPVEATVHSADGLNEMLYQRCVGTRFCQNNCPYKVRRFNFFHYADFRTESLRLQYNPEVTVRSRGVMEKCTYCVQRIRRAEIDSQVEHRGIADGEILTACQAACPAQAIVFGDLNQDGREGRPHSIVRQWHDSPLNYALLADLNTNPRTTYLAAVRNPNPELEGA